MRVVAHICLTVSNRVGLRRTTSYEQRQSDKLVFGQNFFSAFAKLANHKLAQVWQKQSRLGACLVLLEQISL